MRLLDPASGGTEPDTPYLYLKRGEIEERLGRLRDALSDYLHTMQLAPEFPDAPTRIVGVCQRLGASDSTVAVCSAALQLNPNRSDVRRMLAQLLLTLDRTGDAVPHLQALLADDSLDAPVAMQLGVIRYQQGDTRQAIFLFRRARKVDPTIPKVSDWLWRSLDRADSNDAALHLAGEITTASPGTPEGHWYRAITLSRLKRYSEAQGELAAVERLSPGDRDAALLSAMIDMDQGDMEDARAKIHGVLKSTPNDHEALYRLAQVEERAGNPDSAIAIFRRLIDADPKDASALNDAGYLCADRGIHLQEALEWTERAVALDRNNPAFLDSYGWALFRLGRYSEAVAQLEEAAKMSPQPEIRIHLAQALRGAGRLDDARRVLREILGEKPTEDKARELLEEWSESKPERGNLR